MVRATAAPGLELMSAALSRCAKKKRQLLRIRAAGRREGSKRGGGPRGGGKLQGHPRLTGRKPADRRNKKTENKRWKKTAKGPI